MNYVEAGITPIGFLQTNLVFFLINFFLALGSDWKDIHAQYRNSRELWWALASLHVIFPAIIFLASIFFFLPLHLGTGLILVAAMPALSIAALFSWLAHGNTHLTLVTLPVSALISALGAPLIITLWADLNPMAPRDAALINYTPLYTSMVAILVIALPISLGLLARRLWPGLRVATPPALWLLVAISMTIPAALVMSNGERLLASITTTGIAVTFMYAGSAFFILRLMNSLDLGKGSAVSITFLTLTHQLSIAGMFAIEGLGAKSDQVLTAIWWIILQYFLGLALALYLRNKPAPL